MSRSIANRSRIDRSPSQGRHRFSARCANRHGATLKGAWGADPKEAPHPEPEVERAGVHEQPLQHVLVAADVRAAQSTGFVEMRTGTLEQFAASSGCSPAARSGADYALDDSIAMSNRSMTLVELLAAIVADEAKAVRLVRVTPEIAQARV